MKKKSLATLISGLLAVSLTGVGFASWVIIQDAQDVQTGEVHVETVTKKGIALSDFTWDANNSSATGEKADYTFSFAASAANNTGWLRSDTTNPECLTLNFTVKAKLTGDATSGSVTAKVDVVDNNGKGYETATTDNLYIKPVVCTFNTENTAVTSAGVTLNGSLKIEWGTLWEMNPYAFYNAEGKTANSEIGETTYAAHAETHLGNLKTYLEGVTFTLTIDAKVND